MICLVNFLGYFALTLNNESDDYINNQSKKCASRQTNDKIVLWQITEHASNMHMLEYRKYKGIDVIFCLP